MDITISGRPYFFPHIIGFERRSPAYIITSERFGTDQPYKLIGGKSAGGRSKEWLLEGPAIDGHMSCRSIVDACHVIDGI